MAVGSNPEIESLKTKYQPNIPHAVIYNSPTAWQDLVLQFATTNRYMAFIVTVAAVVVLETHFALSHFASASRSLFPPLSL